MSRAAYWCGCLVMKETDSQTTCPAHGDGKSMPTPLRDEFEKAISYIPENEYESMSNKDIALWAVRWGMERIQMLCSDMDDWTLEQLSEEIRQMLKELS